LFKVLKYGCPKYRRKKGDTAWFDWEYSLATAMSHGGRILIQLPPLQNPGDDQFEFIKWFTGLTNFHGSTRVKSSHGIEPLDQNQPDGNIRHGHPKLLKETDGRFTVGWKTSSYINFALNLPLGGEGNVSPHVLLPYSLMDLHTNLNHYLVQEANGRHGHLFIGYRTPTTTHCGGLLVGCEGSESGAWDMLGHFHGASASSSDVSMCGGVKFTKLHLRNIPKEKDCFFIDLARGDWQALRFNYRCPIQADDVRRPPDYSWENHWQ
jgi:hypothetical protein